MPDSCQQDREKNVNFIRMSPFFSFPAFSGILNLSRRVSFSVPQLGIVTVHREPD